MEPNDGASKVQDAQARSCALVATIMFIAAYAIFIFRYDHMGLALGWMPSAIISWAFGWMAYQFPWIGDAIAILLELIAVAIG